ncbi:type II secretion system protein GspL [Enterobacter ludwigii]
MRNRSLQSDELFIHLHDRPGCPVAWYSLPATGPAEEGALEDETQLNILHQRAIRSRVTLLLSARAFLFHQATFNKKVRSRHHATLAWQLESATPCDVNQLSLTILAQKGQDVWLAAVEHSRLTLWLDWLRDADIKAHQALPDVLALPDATERWQAVQLAQSWLIRQSPFNGFSAADDEELAQILTCTDSAIIPVCHSPLPEKFSHWTSCPQVSAMALLAEGARKSNTNILPASPSEQRPASPAWRRLMPVLAGLYLLSFVLPPVISGWHTGQLADRIQAQTEALYWQHFPDRQGRVPTAKHLAEHQETLLRQKPGDGLLAILNDARPLLHKLSDIQTLELRWRDDRLDLLFAAPPVKLETRLVDPPASLELHWHQEAENQTLLQLKRREA